MSNRFTSFKDYDYKSQYVPLPLDFMYGRLKEEQQGRDVAEQNVKLLDQPLKGDVIQREYNPNTGQYEETKAFQDYRQIQEDYKKKVDDVNKMMQTATVDNTRDIQNKTLELNRLKAQLESPTGKLGYYTTQKKLRDENIAEIEKMKDMPEWMKKSAIRYGGSKYLLDEEKDKYTYRPYKLTDYIERNKWVEERLKDVKDWSLEKNVIFEGTSPSGTPIWRDIKTKQVVVAPERINNALSRALQNDPNFKSNLQEEALMKGYQEGKWDKDLETYTQEQLSEPFEKDKAMPILDEKGEQVYTFDENGRKIPQFKRVAKSNILGNLYGFGEKYIDYDVKKEEDWKEHKLASDKALEDYKKSKSDTPTFVGFGESQGIDNYTFDNIKDVNKKAKDAYNNTLVNYENQTANLNKVFNTKDNNELNNVINNIMVNRIKGTNNINWDAVPADIKNKIKDAKLTPEQTKQLVFEANKTYNNLQDLKTEQEIGNKQVEQITEKVIDSPELKQELDELIKELPKTRENAATYGITNKEDLIKFIIQNPNFTVDRALGNDIRDIKTMDFIDKFNKTRDKKFKEGSINLAANTQVAEQNTGYFREINSGMSKIFSQPTQLANAEVIGMGGKNIGTILIEKGLATKDNVYDMLKDAKVDSKILRNEIGGTPGHQISIDIGEGDKKKHFVFRVKNTTENKKVVAGEISKAYKANMDTWESKPQFEAQTQKEIHSSMLAENSYNDGAFNKGALESLPVLDINSTPENIQGRVVKLEATNVPNMEFKIIKTGAFNGENEYRVYQKKGYDLVPMAISGSQDFIKSKLGELAYDLDHAETIGNLETTYGLKKEIKK